MRSPSAADSPLPVSAKPPPSASSATGSGRLNTIDCFRTIALTTSGTRAPARLRARHARRTAPAGPGAEQVFADERTTMPAPATVPNRLRQRRPPAGRREWVLRREPHLDYRTSKANGGIKSLTIDITPERK